MAFLENVMTYTLANLTYELAVELGVVYEGEATGGSTTTLIDTNDLTQADDYWNGGTVWILDDAGGASAAPEGEYGKISDFDNGTSTATIATMTVAPATGDRYAIANKIYPLYTLIQAINRALRHINIEATDTTSVDTAASQTEYTLPAVASMDLREVWVQTVTTDADDNRWYEIRNWNIQKTATGTQEELILPTQLLASRDIKLVYMAPHPKLYDYSDKLDESVHFERVIFRAAWYIMNTEAQQTRNTDPWLIDNREYYKALAERADIRYPILGPQKKGKIMLVDWGTDYDPAPGDNLIVPP